MKEKISFYFKHFEPTDAIKQYVIRKLTKFEKIFHHLEGIHARFILSKKKHLFEITVHADSKTFHIKKDDPDMYAAIDKSIDVLHSVIDKHHKKRSVPEGHEITRLLPTARDKNHLPDENIIWTFDVPLKPIDDEEAILQLRRQGYHFMMYHNFNRKRKYSLVFYRPDGNYSIISPTMRLGKYVEKIFKEGYERQGYKEIKKSSYPLSIMTIPEAANSLYNGRGEYITFVNRDTKRMNVLFHSRSGELILKRPAP